MGRAAIERDATTATYEVRLKGARPETLPETLVAEFGPGQVRRTPPQTVLMRRVDSQDELAALLERVFAMGLVLDEVRALRTVGPPARSYEVRVAGTLDAALLRYLGWPHLVVPEGAALSVQGTPEQVHDFLSACCRLRLGLEQVRLVERLSA